MAVGHSAMNDRFVGFFAIAAGLFAICGALFQWAFFMEHHKARRLVRMFGRQPVRVFYIILGAGLILLGALLASGVLVSRR